MEGSLYLNATSKYLIEYPEDNTLMVTFSKRVEFKSK